MLSKEEIIHHIEDSFAVPTNLNLNTYNQARLFALADKVLSHKLVRTYLAAILTYDQETFGHCLRTGMINTDLYLVHLEKSALLQSKSIVNELETNMVAGFLHDYGKRKIPLEILNAKKYTSKEKMRVRTHSRLTGLLLKELDDYFPYARKIAAGHHQRRVGDRRTEKRRKYQLKLEEEDRQKERRTIGRRTAPRWIQKCQKILNLADILDALGSVREYQKIPPNQIFTNETILTELHKTFPEEQTLIKYIQETYIAKRVEMI